MDSGLQEQIGAQEGRIQGHTRYHGVLLARRRRFQRDEMNKSKVGSSY